MRHARRHTSVRLALAMGTDRRLVGERFSTASPDSLPAAKVKNKTVANPGQRQVPQVDSILLA
jgi:hypothetical protein